MSVLVFTRQTVCVYICVHMYLYILCVCTYVRVYVCVCVCVCVKGGAIAKTSHVLANWPEC